MAKIVWTQEAERWLLKIHDYIAQDKPATAFKVVESIYARAQILEQLPTLPQKASGEDRFVIIGLSANMRLLAVCHCVREVGKVIRIISARRAVKAEQNQYRERLIK